MKRHAALMCLMANAVTADPLGFIDYESVGAPYVDDLVDIGNGVAVARTDAGLAFVRVDGDTVFMCDPRDDITLGTAMMAMLDVSIAEASGCLGFASVEDIMTSVNLRNDVIAAYAERLGPAYTFMDVQARYDEAVNAALRQQPICPSSTTDFLAYFTNPDFVAAVRAALEQEGLPVQRCPGFVELP